MEITNQEVLHGEMVREVLMGMLQEMRPPPPHNVFECRNCQWVERRGKVILKPCENSPAFCPAPPPYEDYCNTCLSFKDCDDLPIPMLFLLSSPVLNMTLNCINYALCFMTMTDTWNEALVKIPWYRYNS